MSDPITIAIVDTQGPELSAAYRAMLPGVEITGAEPAGLAGTPCNPHGAWCGWLAAVPCIGLGLPLRLAFIRVFDKDARFVAPAAWIVEQLRALRPQYVSRSWGSWDGDDALSRQTAIESGRDFTRLYTELREQTGLIDFAAAGNDDANDADEDIAWPQAGMPWSLVIGACRRDGVPARWSGDGKGVRCVMWADGVWSPGPDGVWAKWRGTSAACPKACGGAASHDLGETTFQEFIERSPRMTTPRGSWTRPHRKWGFGCAEDLWQAGARHAPAACFAGRPAGTTASIAAHAHDYRTLRQNTEAHHATISTAAGAAQGRGRPGSQERQGPGRTERGLGGGTSGRVQSGAANPGGMR